MDNLKSKKDNVSTVRFTEDDIGMIDSIISDFYTDLPFHLDYSRSDVIRFAVRFMYKHMEDEGAISIMSYLTSDRVEV